MYFVCSLKPFFFLITTHLIQHFKFFFFTFFFHLLICYLICFLQIVYRTFICILFEFYIIYRYLCMLYKLIQIGTSSLSLSMCNTRNSVFPIFKYLRRYVSVILHVNHSIFIAFFSRFIQRNFLS